MTGLLLLLSASLSHAQALPASCAVGHAYGIPRIQAHLGSAVGAFAAWDPERFEEERQTALEDLACLQATLPPSVAAGFHLVEVLTVFLEPENPARDARGLQAMRSLRAADPTLALDPSYAPDGHPLLGWYAQAAATPIQPEAGLNLVDGTTSPRVPTDRPVVLQVVDAWGQVQWGGYHRPNDPLPDLSAPAVAATTTPPAPSTPPTAPPTTDPTRRVTWTGLGPDPVLPPTDLSSRLSRPEADVSRADPLGGTAMHLGWSETVRSTPETYALAGVADGGIEPHTVTYIDDHRPFRFLSRAGVPDLDGRVEAAFSAGDLRLGGGPYAWSTHDAVDARYGWGVRVEGASPRGMRASLDVGRRLAADIRPSAYFPSEDLFAVDASFEDVFSDSRAGFLVRTRAGAVSEIPCPVERDQCPVPDRQDAETVHGTDLGVLVGHTWTRWEVSGAVSLRNLSSTPPEVCAVDPTDAACGHDTPSGMFPVAWASFVLDLDETVDPSWRLGVDATRENPFRAVDGGGLLARMWLNAPAGRQAWISVGNVLGNGFIAQSDSWQARLGAGGDVLRFLPLRPTWKGVAGSACLTAEYRYDSVDNAADASQGAFLALRFGAEPLP